MSTVNPHIMTPRRGSFGTEIHLRRPRESRVSIESGNEVRAAAAARTVTARFTPIRDKPALGRPLPSLADLYQRSVRLSWGKKEDEDKKTW